MQTHRADAAVQAAGCAALRALAESKQGPTEVEEGMEDHAPEEGGEGAEGLDEERNDEGEGATGLAVAAVMGALAEHAASSRVAWAGCATLATLAEGKWGGKQNKLPSAFGTVQTH
eukprot:140269-Prorocentrum_minimum.AAC.1